MAELAVENRCDGWRLDRFVREALPGMPLSHIFKLFRTGKVRLDGRKAPASARIAAGQAVIIHVPDAKFKADSTAEPKEKRGRAVPPFPLEIIFEDEEMVAINKPAGVPVHPGSGYASGSCIDRIVERFAAGRHPGDFMPALVHRLDLDTSGVLIAAKTYRALRALGKTFEMRRVKKTYLALAAGALLPDSGTIDLPVKRLDGPDRPYKEPRGVTDFRVAARAAQRDVKSRGWPAHVALVEISILTGRTHQIRSHLKSIGAPVVGDRLYGNPQVNEVARREAGLDRQFLHARRVELDHPTTGAPVIIEAPLPPDLERVFASLRLA
ncbi:MAG: RluA family pseudouridine synthase [Deltaproteobacteria bacterium]|nr:RluA family pseudouridine synthase [Deltaproteobacteria bacterium]